MTALFISPPIVEESLWEAHRNQNPDSMMDLIGFKTWQVSSDDHSEMSQIPGQNGPTNVLNYVILQLLIKVISSQNRICRPSDQTYNRADIVQLHVRLPTVHIDSKANQTSPHKQRITSWVNLSNTPIIVNVVNTHWNLLNQGPSTNNQLQVYNCSELRDFKTKPIFHTFHHPIKNENQHIKNA